MSFDELVARADRAVQGVLGGESVTYEPEFGAAVTVTGMFDENYVLAKGTAPAGVEATAPAVFLSAEERAKLPVDPKDDEPTVTVRGVDYRVIERPTDGLGGIVLVLRART